MLKYFLTIIIVILVFAGPRAYSMIEEMRPDSRLGARSIVVMREYCEKHFLKMTNDIDSPSFRDTLVPAPIYPDEW